MVVLKHSSPRRSNFSRDCTYYYLIATIDCPFRLYCTVYIELFYFRTLVSDDFKRRITRRLEEQKSKEFDPSITMMISQGGEKRIGNKVDMVARLVGYKPRINTRRDQPCMEKYFSKVVKLVWIKLMLSDPHSYFLMMLKNWII